MRLFSRRRLRIASLLLGLALVVFWIIPSRSDISGLEKIRKRGYLLWGADAEGGAPYIFPDPRDPATMIGFEVEIADAIAGELGVKARHSQHAWDSLIPALERGDFDIAMNGIEITPRRGEKVLFSQPYYIHAVGMREYAHLFPELRSSTCPSGGEVRA